MNWFLLILQGACKTLAMMAGAGLISLVFGCVIGVVSSEYGVKALRFMLELLTLLLRGIPYYVQLLVCYFVLPDITGWNWSAEVAAIVSLGLCSMAYTSQIIKGALNAFPKAQWRAAVALGYSDFAIARFILLPQVLRSSLRALFMEIEQLTKSTSVVGAIGVLEITRVGQNIISRQLNPLPVFACIAACYLALSFCLNQIMRFLERRLQIDLYTKS